MKAMLRLKCVRVGMFVRGPSLERVKERFRTAMTRGRRIRARDGARIRQSARADSESRERLHLDAIDATDEADDAIGATDDTIPPT